MAKGQTNSLCVIGGGGTQGIPTAPCTNITITKGNGQVSLTWNDPSLIETIHGVDIEWKNTTVRYKKGSAPTSANDGTLAVVETTRNQYSTSPLVISGLENGSIYYVSVFPVSTKNAINTDANQIVSATPKAKSIWTVKIDQKNSNPLTCCTYADDAVGMTKGSSEWDDIFGYKPCIMKNGAVVGYLNPNDFTKYVDGSSAPITNSSYDVMIEFPRMGLNISTDSNDVITISLTNDTSSSEFGYLAHKRGNVQKDYFYLGAYDATDRIESAIGSNSDWYPIANITISSFIDRAQNKIKGSKGYEIMGFYQWTYIQALYIMKYGNLNSQQTLGKGYVGGSTSQRTGYTDKLGMCYGDPNSGTDRVKLFGLEDLWGNIYQFICGLYSDNSRNLLTTTDNFGTNTTTSVWEYSVPSNVDDSSGYISKVQGTQNGGFVSKQFNGSTTTYFSDLGSLGAGRFPAVGGGWRAGDGAGVFFCNVNNSASAISSGIGSRLMYL